MSELKSLTPDEVFVRVSKSLDQVSDGATRVYTAKTLLGKAGANLLPVMNDIAEKGKLVGSVTNEMAAMADKYERSLIALDARKKALYNTIAQALLPTMIDLVDALSKGDTMMVRLNKTAKEMAQDHTIQDWARSAAMSVAWVVDIFDGLARVINIVGKAIGAAAADIASFANGFGGLGVTFKQGGMDAVKAQINGAFAEIKSHGESFDKDMDDILAKPFMRDKLSAEFASRDAGGKAIKPNRRDKDIDLPDAIGKSASAYENFLFELDRMATKLDQGLVAELTLKAQQLAQKEGKDPSGAAGRIAAVQAAEEKRFMADYQRDLDKQIEAEKFRIDLVGKTAHEQELLNIQHKAKIDLQQKLAEETKKLGPLTQDTQDHMLSASQQATDKMIAAANARYEAERRWSTGAKNAIKSYSEDIASAAAQSNKLFTDAFKGMEDALVKFVKTGKLDFKSLADSIITDLIRIQIQNQVMAPLVGTKADPGLLSQGISALGSFFGGGRASGGDVLPGQYYVVGENGPEILVPNGAGTVIPNGAGASGSGGDGGNVNINFNVQAIDAASFRSSLAANKNIIVGVVREAFTRRAITSPI